MGILDKLFGEKSKDLEAKKKTNTKKSTKAMSEFAPWTSGDVCDVCNVPLREGTAYKILIDMFYSSPRYKDWFIRNQIPILRTTYGVPSDITVDMVFADMRNKNSTHFTHYSAVCDKYEKLFVFVKSREPEKFETANRNINAKDVQDTTPPTYAVLYEHKEVSILHCKRGGNSGENDIGGKNG